MAESITRTPTITPPRRSIVFLFTFDDGTQETRVAIYDTDAELRRIFAMLREGDHPGQTATVHVGESWRVKGPRLHG